MRKFISLILFTLLLTQSFANSDVLFRKTYPLPIYYYHYLNYIKPNPQLKEVRTYSKDNRISDFGVGFFDKALNFRRIEKDTYIFQEENNITKVVFLENKDSFEINIFQHGMLINKINIFFDNDKIKTISTDSYARGKLETRKVDDYFYNSEAKNYMQSLPTRHVSRIYNNKMVYLDGYTEIFTIEKNKYISTKVKGNFTVKESFTIKDQLVIETRKQILVSQTGRIVNSALTNYDYDKNKNLKLETRFTNGTQTLFKKAYNEGDFLFLEIKNTTSSNTFKLNKDEIMWTQCIDQNYNIWNREFIY